MLSNSSDFQISSEKKLVKVQKIISDRETQIRATKLKYVGFFGVSKTSERP